MGDAVVIGALAPKINAITDFTKFNNFVVWQKAVGVAVINTYEDWLNITGKGFLSYVYFIITANESTILKVTIDGDIIFEGGLSASDKLSGILNYSQLHQYTSGNATLSVVTPQSDDITISDSGTFANRVSLPYTAGSNTGTFALVLEPLYFGTSLRIQIKKATTEGDMYLNYEGAYI